MDKEQILQLSKIDVACDSVEAKRRYEEWKHVDPYPLIAPALLNSADIVSYINAASLVFPFTPEQLKSCAYEMTLGDTVLYWDETGKRRYYRGLKRGASVRFPKNSIVYVTTAEELYIPDYLALRFNMVIKHVHRGMLLGTGPLINPGYSGRIMIPIHNFTRNEYRISVGDRLISIEVTKISRYTQSLKSDEQVAPAPCSLYVQNDSEYIGATFKKFLQRAVGAEGQVRSAIEEVITGVHDRLGNVEKETREYTETHIRKAEEETKKSIELVCKAVDEAMSAKDRLEISIDRTRRWSLIGAIGIVVGFCALILAAYTYHVNVTSTLKQQIESERTIISDYKNELEENRKTIDGALVTISANVIDEISRRNSLDNSTRQNSVEKEKVKR
ncbi:Deoxycytidine triphosphate deaminase [Humidesulfovibrio mexicanus]|uniref:Deoxycytidine triphosphate deaminase n=1 Tax=Humidesulfovibrio mexicanus TaxID=147047 RepID=A0A239B5G6_9BACT|nr:hypothetical protein [Humidesulfovibrio mexicanus]SNS03110.1 Deoxycytidine triphosphate deaminase [Humidesulfovibrio mexicanus]